MRETSTGVDATVEIAFKENYVITATEVQKKIVTDREDKNSYR